MARNTPLGYIRRERKLICSGRPLSLQKIFIGTAVNSRDGIEMASIYANISGELTSKDPIFEIAGNKNIYSSVA